MATTSVTEQSNIIIRIKPKPEDCVVELKSGEKLGQVQRVEIFASVGELSSAVIHTICTTAEVELLEKNTKLIIKIEDKK